jgi:hypothetical protein
MSSVVKIFLICLLLSSEAVGAKQINILVLGDASAGGCNEHQFPSIPHVFQIGASGNIKPAKDPLDWSGCPGGGIWIPVGQKLIEGGFAQEIVFLAVGLPEANVGDWLGNKDAFLKLSAALEMAGRMHMHFDYVLWQQGYADARYNSDRYFNGLHGIIKFVALKASVGKWIIARGAGCPAAGLDQVLKAQERISRLPVYNQYAGPDTTMLDPVYRYGKCGLSATGQNHLARMWVQSISDVEHKAQLYQKESLLYYFR